MGMYCWYFSNWTSMFQMHLLGFCIILTLINSSKLIFPSWSRSPVAIRFSVISLTLYPGRGKQAALNKSFSSLQLMYPLPSVSVRQTRSWWLRAIWVTTRREVREGWMGGQWVTEAGVHGVAKRWTRLRDFTFTFHFPALEKEMATHSSVLA